MRTRAFWVVIGALALIAVVFIIYSGAGADPADIRTFIDEKGGEAVALRDWMLENDLDAIKLLNKSNRMYGSGVSIQAGRLYCYFEGPGTDTLMRISGSELINEPTDKAFYLVGLAKQYGAYEYIIHPDVFEITLSSDVYSRPPGAEGTSVYYSETDNELDIKTELGISAAEDMGDGWFTGGVSRGLVLNTPFTIPLEVWALLVLLAVYILVVLLFRKHRCTAQILEKKREYVGRRPRIINQIQGAYFSVSDGYNAYKVTFLTDKDEILDFYVRKGQYNALAEGSHGLLEYKRLWNMLRFKDFKADKE